MNSDFREHSRKSRPSTERRETGEVTVAGKYTASTFQESTRESGEHFQTRGGKMPKRKRTVHRVPIMMPKSANLKKILETCQRNSGVS